MHDGSPDSVIPAAQNLMLAARALGIGCVPTTLHPVVMPRFSALFGVPDGVGFHFCVPLGYPQGNFGPNVRKRTSETTFLNRRDAAVPWKCSRRQRRGVCPKWRRVVPPTGCLSAGRRASHQAPLTEPLAMLMHSCQQPDAHHD
jgi:hypothetical protein